MKFRKEGYSMTQIENYVNEVLQYIVADRNMKMRIKGDLSLQLEEAARTESLDEVIRRMGSPKDVAKEFMDSIYEDKSELVDELISSRSEDAVYMKRVVEYKSKLNLFGIPLIHVKLSRYGKPAVAKGIIAIGTVSFGIISIGALPFGVISLGGVAIGLFSFGGIALGLLMAFGGVAIGGLAIGGMAIGLGTIGGFSIGEIAIGGYARGTVAIGANAVGEYTLTTRHVGPETRDQIAGMIRTAFPNLPDWVVNFFSGITANLNSNGMNN